MRPNWISLSVHFANWMRILSKKRKPNTADVSKEKVLQLKCNVKICVRINLHVFFRIQLTIASINFVLQHC